ncbi:hypothetical protein [Butyrivibrio sp. FC2001]|uniref:hypothetical protein n=1 Tax=Butyrivibrio sp. FC2001 TaxID=1280671 RepID=UPI00041D3BCA|nr:hypothetical protein [Butyrivibrio sp. FC2001]
MKKDDILENLNKAKDKIVEAGSGVGEIITETGKNVRDSKTVEKITQGAKKGVEKVSQGAKAGAERVSQGAAAGAEKVKNSVEELSGNPFEIEGHTVLRFKGIKTKLLVPDHYEVVTDKALIKTFQEMFGLEKIEISYVAQTTNSINVAMFFRPKKGKNMDFENVQGVIDDIHESLAENQGLIEAKSGKTKRGYDYIYSIVKSVREEEGIPMGVIYFLRMDVGFEGNVVEIYANFEEQGTTGLRESMVACMAQNAGICDMGSDKWMEDPYDSEYKRGIPKNLAEKEGLDGLFPDNPLTQAREFILAIINDELVTVGNEDSDEEDEDKKELSEEEKQQKSKEFMAGLFEDECRRYTERVDVEPEKDSADGSSDKKLSLNEQLEKAVEEYNFAYTQMSDKGTGLYIQRERSVDLIKNVENLVNSIANHPKEFDASINDIVTLRQNFKSTCDFAKKELESAQRSAMSAGAGAAGGAVVAAIAPSAAMWIATTFGTAFTGTAISTLSGAAATNAALAWLGGGALTAGGGGMVAGHAFLALAGPIGMGIAGASLLTSIILFANKKVKIEKEKKEEIQAVLNNTASLRETDEKIKLLLEQTEQLRESVNLLYGKALNAFGRDFLSLSEELKMQLGSLVNETKALASLLEKGVD